MNFKQIFTCFNPLTSNTKNIFCSSFQKFFWGWLLDSRFLLDSSPPPRTTHCAFFVPPRRHLRCLGKRTACSTARCWAVCINYFFKKHQPIFTLDFLLVLNIIVICYLNLSIFTALIVLISTDEPSIYCFGFNTKV